MKVRKFVELGLYPEPNNIEVDPRQERMIRSVVLDRHTGRTLLVILPVRLKKNTRVST